MEQMKQLRKRVNEYVADKAELGPLEKKVDSNNTAIKQLMELLGKDEIEADNGLRVVYGVSKTETLDEEKLLVMLKDLVPDTPCIKTKEYIDMDILESEIYHGRVSDDVMCALDACRETKEKVTLNIRKPKKG